MCSFQNHPVNFTGRHGCGKMLRLINFACLFCFQLKNLLIAMAVSVQRAFRRKEEEGQCRIEEITPNAGHGRESSNQCSFEKEVTSEWSELPHDILEEIGERLLFHADHIRYIAVCRLWRSSLTKRPKLETVPLLVLPPSSKDSCNFPRLYNIVDDTSWPIELPYNISRDFAYRGSCYGWLVIVSQGIDLTILNSLSGVQIALPPISTFPDVKEYNAERLGKEYHLYSRNYTYYAPRRWVQDIYIWKVVLSSSPLDERCVAIASYGGNGRLVFFKLHDDDRKKVWTKVSTSKEIFCDITFRDGKFYAINYNAQLTFGDIGKLPNAVDSKVKAPRGFQPESTFYLVWNADGELLLVERNYTRMEYRIPHPHEKFPTGFYVTKKFKVYKLENFMKWSKIESIGNYLMFIGKNSTSLIEAHEFPSLKSNCIYYSDDKHEFYFEGYRGGSDIGVFDLEDGLIKPLPAACNTYTYAKNNNNKFISPSPVWILPSFRS